MRYLLIIALLAGCATPPGGPPAEPLTASEMRNLKLEAMVFARFVTGYPQAPLPTVKILPSLRAEYARLHGQDSWTFDWFWAVYEPRTRTIWLHDWVDLRSAEGRGVMVHEITHYLQFQHRKDLCKYRIEREAFSVQIKYLERHGISSPHSAAQWARMYGTGCAYAAAKASSRPSVVVREGTPIMPRY